LRQASPRVLDSVGNGVLDLSRTAPSCAQPVAIANFLSV
jgi:hypothetical protein